MDVTFRLAQPQDAPRILEIYRPYVEDITVSFEAETPALDVFTQRMRGIMAAYPYIVAEQGGVIIGYAYATRYHERAAYNWSAGLSVYMDGSFKAKGVGSRLYTGLMRILALQNVQSVYGLIVDSNKRSLAFHERMGFERIGLHHNVGYKLGEWHNVSIYERHIGSHPNPPQPFIPIPQLDAGEVAGIIGSI